MEEHKVNGIQPNNQQEFRKKRNEEYKAELVNRKIKMILKMKTLKKK